MIDQPSNALTNVQANVQSWGPKWPLMLLPPLLLFFKDLIAINAVLATEPGVTARTAAYFGLSQLPGALLAGDLGGAMFVNQTLAFLTGGLIWFCEARRSRPRRKK